MIYIRSIATFLRTDNDVALLEVFFFCMPCYVLCNHATGTNHVHVDVVVSDCFPRVAIASSSIPSTVFMSDASENDALDDDDLWDVVERPRDSPFVEVEVLVHRDQSMHDMILPSPHPLPNTVSLTPVSEVEENEDGALMSFTDASFQFGPLPSKRYQTVQVDRTTEKSKLVTEIETAPLRNKSVLLSNPVKGQGSGSPTLTAQASFFSNFSNIFTRSKSNQNGFQPEAFEMSENAFKIDSNETKSKPEGFVDKPSIPNRNKSDFYEENGCENHQIAKIELTSSTEKPSTDCIVM